MAKQSFEVPDKNARPAPLSRGKYCSNEIKLVLPNLLPQQWLKLVPVVGLEQNKQIFQNPLLSHYPPTTQKEPLHYSRTPIESGDLKNLSSTRHYAPITN